MTGYLFVLFLDVFQCVLFCLQASIRSVHIDHILLFASRLTHDQDSSFLVIPHLVQNNYIYFAKLVTLGSFTFIFHHGVFVMALMVHLGLSQGPLKFIKTSNKYIFFY